MSAFPKWWNEADAAAVALHAQWLATDWWPNHPTGMDTEAYFSTPEFVAADKRVDAFLKPTLPKWNCRRCQFWQSADGITGECFGPEVACGTTVGAGRCEQWQPRK